MRWFTRAFGGDARGPRDVDSALRSALLAVLDSDLDRAEESIAHAVRLDADAIDAYLALARLYRLRGEVGRAIRVDQNLLLRNDLGAARRVAVLLDLGEDFRQGGFLRRAIAAYDEVLQDDRKNLRALRALVALLPAVREYERGIELTRRLARAEGRSAGPAEAVLWVELSNTSRAEGDNEAARRAAKKAVRRDKHCVAAWIALGEAEAERGRSKAALAAWRRVPELDAGKAKSVYPRLEASFAALDRSAEYEELLQGVLASRPTDRDARLALAAWRVARGDVDVALETLRPLIEADPDDLEARGAFARILLANGREREASKEHAALIDALERRGLLGAREHLE